MPDPLQPILLRRLQPKALVVPAFGCLMVGLGFALSDKVFTLRLLFALPVLAGFILRLVLIACARTKLGPDGIRNRTFLAETFIPWWDVKDVVITSGVITSGGSHRLQVVRAGHQRPVILAAAREDLDYLAALIAEQAGLVKHANPEEPAELVELTVLSPPGKVPGWSNAPLTLRPSRLPLWWLLPVAIALPASFATNAAGFTQAPSLPFLLPVSIFLIILAIKLVRGRTTAGPEGITNRLIAKRKFMAWEEIVGFRVVGTLFGRTVTVQGSAGTTMTLAAPREGLLGRDLGFNGTLKRLRAATIVPWVLDPEHMKLARAAYVGLLGILLIPSMLFWGPWLEPWWPSRHEAASVPRACDVVGSTALDLLVSGGSTVPKAVFYQDHGTYAFTSCAWVQVGDAADNSIWAQSLGLFMTLERRTPGGKSGTAYAQDDFRLSTRRSARASDGTWVRTTGDHEVEVQLRRANVVITVDYEATNRSDYTAQAEALARAVAAKIKLG